MMYTTLSRTKKHGPYKDRWEKLLDHLGKTEADDEPLAFATIVNKDDISKEEQEKLIENEGTYYSYVYEDYFCCMDCLWNWELALEC